ncbi:hypothetical protein F4814DRAFT_456319 [Daldinia grandis]|nr:hypothetical protein F4814DRAFT_456319 [Daldinia grandis]
MGILGLSNLNGEEVKSPLSLIKSTKLPHPYVKKRLELGEASSLVDGWLYIVESITKNGHSPPRLSPAENHAIRRRDGGKCCVAGKVGSLHDPLVIVPILPVPSGWVTDKASITNMLGAFFGLPYRDWWLSYARNPEGNSPYSKSFASELVRLNKLHPSMAEIIPIGPDDPIEFDGIRPLLGDHLRFQYLDLYQRLSSKTLYQPSHLPTGHSAQRSNITLQNRRNLLSLCAVALFAVWRLVPSQTRIFCYKALLKLGKRLYGSPSGYPEVQKLPFGLYLKLDGDDDFSRNESYLLMKRDSSFPLSRCQNLKDYVAQLRNISQLTKSDRAICNTLGEACRDPRIRHADSIGSFVDEAVFNQMLRFSDDPARRGHKIVFTHTDLNPYNILSSQSVQSDGSIGWGVMGIVRTGISRGTTPSIGIIQRQMLEGFRWTQRYNDLVRSIFGEFVNYSRELEVEKKSWEMLKS